jgi:hypothetical protein
MNGSMNGATVSVTTTDTARGRNARPRGRAARRSTGILAAALPVLLAAGCGIRTTTVPVDAGPAPSRLGCVMPRVSGAPEPDTVLRQVYLVCATQVTPVRRSVPVPAGAFDRLAWISALLDQLQREPLTTEAPSGFATAVPRALKLTGPVKGDPREALRLSQPPDELPSFTLAQIVCTLTAATDLLPTRTLLLGGPTPATPLRAYTCTSDLRTRPDAADTAGVPVR